MPKGPYYAPGRYWGKIVDHSLEKTKTGKPQIIVRFAVIGAVDPANPEGNLISTGNPQERTVYRVITEATKPYVEADLERLGFDGDRLSQLCLTNPDHVDLRGRELAFFCQHEADQNGTMRERWSLAFDNKREIRPLEAKELRQLDAMFGKALKKKTPVPTTRQTPPKQQPQLSENGNPAAAFATTQKENDAADAVDVANAALQEAASGPPADDIPF